MSEQNESIKETSALLVPKDEIEANVSSGESTNSSTSGVSPPTPALPPEQPPPAAPPAPPTGQPPPSPPPPSALPPGVLAFNPGQPPPSQPSETPAAPQTARFRFSKGTQRQNNNPKPKKFADPSKGFNFCHDFLNSICTRSTCSFFHGTLEQEEYFKKFGKLPPKVPQTAVPPPGPQASEVSPSGVKRAADGPLTESPPPLKVFQFNEPPPNLTQDKTNMWKRCSTLPTQDEDLFKRRHIKEEPNTPSGTPTPKPGAAVSLPFVGPSTGTAPIYYAQASMAKNNTLDHQSIEYSRLYQRVGVQEKNAAELLTMLKIQEKEIKKKNAVIEHLLSTLGKFTIPTLESVLQPSIDSNPLIQANKSATLVQSTDFLLKNTIVSQAIAHAPVMTSASNATNILPSANSSLVQGSIPITHVKSSNQSQMYFLPQNFNGQSQVQTVPPQQTTVPQPTVQTQAAPRMFYSINGQQGQIQQTQPTVITQLGGQQPQPQSSQSGQILFPAVNSQAGQLHYTQAELQTVNPLYNSQKGLVHSVQTQPSILEQPTRTVQPVLQVPQARPIFFTQSSFGQQGIVQSPQTQSTVIEQTSQGGPQPQLQSNVQHQIIFPQTFSGQQTQLQPSASQSTVIAQPISGQQLQSVQYYSQPFNGPSQTRVQSSQGETQTIPQHNYTQQSQVQSTPGQPTVIAQSPTGQMNGQILVGSQPHDTVLQQHILNGDNVYRFSAQQQAPVMVQYLTQTE